MTYNYYNNLKRIHYNIVLQLKSELNLRHFYFIIIVFSDRFNGCPVFNNKVIFSAVKLHHVRVHNEICAYKTTFEYTLHITVQLYYGTTFHFFSFPRDNLSFELCHIILNGSALYTRSTQVFRDIFFPFAPHYYSSVNFLTNNPSILFVCV